jgi:hypothetical protein
MLLVFMLLTVLALPAENADQPAAMLAGLVGVCAMAFAAGAIGVLAASAWSLLPAVVVVAILGALFARTWKREHSLARQCDRPERPCCAINGLSGAAGNATFGPTSEGEPARIGNTLRSRPAGRRRQ